ASTPAASTPAASTSATAASAATSSARPVRRSARRRAEAGRGEDADPPGALRGRPDHACQLERAAARPGGLAVAAAGQALQRRSPGQPARRQRAALMRMRGMGRASACVLVLGLGSVHAAAGAHPAPPYGPAAFSSDIYAMAADGSHQVNLTNDPVGDGYPDWSPDGQKIVYSRTVSDADLWVMNADGSGQTSLTGEPISQDLDPDWSPDG